MQSLYCVRLFIMHKQQAKYDKYLLNMLKYLLQIPGIVLL